MLTYEAAVRVRYSNAYIPYVWYGMVWYGRSRRGPLGDVILIRGLTPALPLLGRRALLPAS